MDDGMDDPTADTIVSHVDLYFSWWDRVRILLGRTVRATTRTKTTIGVRPSGVPFIRIMASATDAVVDPLWKPRPGLGMEAPR